MADFQIACKKVLEDEGIFSDDANDRGGKTKYGITENVAKKHGYTTEMKDLPLDFAIEIYRLDYWNPLRLNFVNDQSLAEILFQFGVNCGIGTACKSLQRALNLLNRNNISWIEAILDGIMGSQTLGIVNKLSKEDLKYTCGIVLGLQFERYVSIIERDSSQEDFTRGWVNRIVKYLKEVIL